jgi:hypothetical protein
MYKVCSTKCAVQGMQYTVYIQVQVQHENVEWKDGGRRDGGRSGEEKTWHGIAWQGMSCGVYLVVVHVRQCLVWCLGCVDTLQKAEDDPNI